MWGTPTDPLPRVFTADKHPRIGIQVRQILARWQGHFPTYLETGGAPSLLCYWWLELIPHVGAMSMQPHMYIVQISNCKAQI